MCLHDACMHAAFPSSHSRSVAIVKKVKKKKGEKKKKPYQIYAYIYIAHDGVAPTNQANLMAVILHYHPSLITKKYQVQTGAARRT